MAQNGTKSANITFQEGSVIPLWRDGKEIKTVETFRKISPNDEKVLYSCSSATEEDAIAAIAAAEKAFETWSKTKPAERREILLKAVEEFEKRREEQWHYSHTETGSSEQFFDFNFTTTIDMIKTVAGLIVTVNGTVPTLAEEGRSAMVLPEPYGVVVGIAPWNAPSILGTRAFLGPIAMGNTVVLKGPEAAPACYWLLADVFHKAGLPPGVLNTIYHRPENAAKVTETLISSTVVKKVNFTGSTAVGSIIAGLAGKNLKPVVMELGGKAPAIVCEDADLAAAALQCVIGAFAYSGQICMSTERVLVHQSVFDKFKETMSETVEKIFGGDAMTLISSLPVGKNKTLLQDAISKGAKPIVGDASDDYHGNSATKMRPVILEGVQKGMDLYYTESFGPSVSLFPVASDDEAIGIANDTEYGLASAVFTEDLRRGIKIAKQIETGAVHINSMSVHDENNLPHGGAKKSGWGRFNAQPGLNEWVRLKTITWKD